MSTHSPMTAANDAGVIFDVQTENSQDDALRVTPEEFTDAARVVAGLFWSILRRGEDPPIHTHAEFREAIRWHIANVLRGER